MWARIEAIYDFIVAIRKYLAKDEIIEDGIKEDEISYSTFSWQCWLCSEEAEFTCPSPSEETNYSIECSNCHVENVISIHPGE